MNRSDIDVSRALLESVNESLNTVQEHRVFVGAFYEMPTGEIACITGWEIKRGTVHYQLDDDHGTRFASQKEFSSWKRRPDLVDFPNARDPRLPEFFDLRWDVKHRSGLPELLVNGEDTDGVMSKMEKHGIVLTDSEQAEVKRLQSLKKADPRDVEIERLRAVVERARVLVGLLTVRTVIEAGDKAIDAAGLNPWCINEGHATGDEKLHTWWLSSRPHQED